VEAPPHSLLLYQFEQLAVLLPYRREAPNEVGELLSMECTKLPPLNLIRHVRKQRLAVAINLRASDNINVGIYISVSLAGCMSSYK